VTKFPSEELKAPFKLDEIEWLVIKSGYKEDYGPWAQALPYLSARAVMERLDDVFGVDCWDDSYERIEGGFICTISARCGGSQVYKSDVASDTEVDPLKGGCSGAFKRAACKFGIGRYLYKLDAQFMDFTEVTRKTKGSKGICIQGNWYYWVPPKLPMWALPTKDKELRRSKVKPKPGDKNCPKEK